MAYQTGIINYKGSFKSIRNYKNVGDPTIYAGEKGGANRDLIMNNPAFARTRENMNEFGGCGVAAKAILHGLLQLLPEHADTHFTGRLMKIIKMINLKDPEGKRGVRAIKISQNKTMLKSLNLHEKRKIDFELKRCVRTSHSDLRNEATLTVNGFNPEPHLVPGNAQYYRVVNHLSIISDHAYVKEDKKYKSLSTQNASAAYVYSDYIPVNTSLSAELKASFSVGTVPGTSDTVIQCVGIEFYNRAGTDGYAFYSTGTMLLYDVF
jgi:hypothetical protein